MKWGFSTDDKCDCGMTQNFEHLLICPNLKVKMHDLFIANDKAIHVADFWGNSI